MKILLSGISLLLVLLSPSVLLALAPASGVSFGVVNDNASTATQQLGATVSGKNSTEGSVTGESPFRGSNPLLPILPFSSFLLVLLSLRLRLKNRSWREAFVATSLLLGSCVVLGTEGLSLLRLISSPTILCFWSIITFASALFLYQSVKKPQESMRIGAEKMTPVSYLLWGWIALYVLGIAIIAFVSPPNNWDSMEYHMPKVMHWIQNGSVSFYPTAIPRQNHLAPGSEFLILHLQLLSGSDRFANMVEWFAMVGCLVAVSLIARQFHANLVGQLFASVFVLTLPMGIMQASSTQTDYVVSFWFACFVYYLMRLLMAASFNWPVFLGLAVSLGLATFSKATTYVFATAFLIWMALAQIKHRRWQAVGAFCVLTLVFLCLNFGHYARNWNAYGNPLGPYQEPAPNTKYSLDSHSPAALMSSLSKHIGTHINTPWPQFNAAILRGYASFHQAIGWEIGDPHTTWGSHLPPFRILTTPFHDESDGNPVHFLLAFIGCLLVLLVPSLRRDPALLKYGGAIAAGFLLFACYLKWHPWMSRLHLPFFVAAGPFVAVVLLRLCSTKVTAGMACLLLLLAIPWLLFCQQRPVYAQENIFNTTRERLYFKTPHQNYQASFLKGRDFLRSRNISQVGLIAGNSSWEYMWWALLQEPDRVVRIEHVNVADASNRLYSKEPFCNFQPEAVVTLDQQGQPEKIKVGVCDYTKRWSNDSVSIYLKD